MPYQSALTVPYLQTFLWKSHVSLVSQRIFYHVRVLLRFLDLVTLVVARGGAEIDSSFQAAGFGSTGSRRFRKGNGSSSLG